ncbi:MAG TPA: hypothetical protein VFC19_06880, partial [Candidatus Limnocylindrales bacterium]|nr:hypothetical protein [Candidatus Limnocylindrales bacterium]
IMLAAHDGAADQPVPASASTGIELTAVAIGAALVGGTSAFGRRGGLFGTILGTSVLALLMVYGDQSGWNISPLLLAGGAVGTGLIVTRLVETFGRPLSVDDNPDDWNDVGVGGATSWSTPSSSSSSTTTGDPWSGLSSPTATPPSTPTTTTQWGDTDRWH